jgi:predicted ATPase
VIPRPLDAFIGRDRELAQVVDRLRAGARCVTLVGPGGVGKTRLGLEVAHLLARQLDTVIFVDLSACRNATDARSALAQALRTTCDDVDDLTHALAARGPALLVADNAEQIAREMRELLATVLAGASEARALVTSRRPLGLAGETPFEIGPLGCAAGAEASLLLLERAGRVASRAALEPSTADRIAAAVDGLPLAIEFAAARLTLLAPTELADRLERGSVTLGDGTRDRRHSTLRACVEWSFQSMNDAERRALAALATLSSDFSSALAEAVIEQLGDDGALDRLHVLRHQSLLAEAGAGFRLLRPIRELVREALRPGEAEQRAVIRALARFSSEQARALDGPFAADALRWIGENRMNLEGALTAFIASSSEQPLVEPDLALTILGALERATRERGPSGAVPELACALVALPSFARWPRPAMLRGLWLAARTLLCAADLRQSRQLLERARPLAESPAERALVEFTDGSLLYAEGRLAEAQARFESALARAETSDEIEIDLPRPELLSSLAVAYHVQGDMGRASQSYDAALALIAGRAIPRVEAELRARRGFFAYDLGELDAAEHEFALGSALHESLGAELRAARLCGCRGNVARSRGDFSSAERFYAAAISGLRNAGDRVYEAVFSMDRGILRALERNPRAARSELEHALAEAESIGAGRVAALILGYLAVVAAQCGELDGARLERAAELSADDALLAELEQLQAAHVAWIASGAPSLSDDLAERAQRARAARFEHLRLAAKLVELGALERSPPLGVIVVEADPATDVVHRVRNPAGIWHDISKREAPRRILEALVGARRAQPGLAVPADTLIAAGWPGEKVLPAAGRNRLRVAMSCLRGLGLEQTLRFAAGGYWIDADVVRRRSSMMGATRTAPKPGQK